MRELKKLFWKPAAAVVALTVLVVSGFFVSHRVRAQGVATQPGQVFPVNYLAPTVATGLAGAVTNPSGLLATVAGGPIYCSGAVDTIAQAQLTLNANTTYLIVYNCPQALLYAKTAVTGPGSAGTVPPGVPASVLFAIPGVEIPLATVVCGASTCGTITDNRPLAALPGVTNVAGHQGVPAINGDYAFTATLSSGTVTKVFTTPFQVAYGCNVTWTGAGTLTTGATLKAVNTSLTQVVITSSTGTDTAVVFVQCVGQPN